MRHREVFHYEVELKVTNPNTTEARLVTREEAAYGPADAWIQALLAIGADAGSADIKLVHIRPTAAAIAQSQVGLDKAIVDAVQRFGSKAGQKIGRRDVSGGQLTARGTR